MAKKVRKAVFPAAGLGTRFLPATKALPKEMLPLVDKPIIQYGVEEAMAAGCDQIIIVTGRGKTAIEDHFDVSYELEKMLEEQMREAAQAMDFELAATLRDQLFEVRARGANVRTEPNRPRGGKSASGGRR